MIANQPKRKACLEIIVLFVILLPLIIFIIFILFIRDQQKLMKEEMEKVETIEGVFESVEKVQKEVLVSKTKIRIGHSDDMEEEEEDEYETKTFYRIRFEDGREMDFPNVSTVPINKGEYVKIYYNGYGIQDVIKVEK